MKTNRARNPGIAGRLAVLLPALLMAGCVVGPDYLKPDVRVPGTFRAEIAPAAAQSFADLPWWSVFNDPALQRLVRDSLANNYDLQIAVARIEQARAQVGIVSSEGMPHVDYGGTVEGGNVFTPGGNRSGGYGAATGILSAAWELDIWGRIKHATDAARADLLAQEDVRRAVMLTLVADVATGYFRLIALDRELAIAQESARAYKQTLDLFSARFEAGKDSRLPVERAQASYESSNALTHELRRQIGQQENALSTLAGAYPKPIERGRTLNEQITPETPVGSTTALLQRRPDIVAAEQGMIAANERIGEAVADYFPRIGLSALIGGSSAHAGDAWHSFGVWNAALALTGPIWSGGELDASYHQRQAFWDETVAQYKQKVVVAFQETSDALIARHTLADRRKSLAGQVKAARSSVALARDRYGAGRASYFEVLEAQQQLYDAEQQLAQTESDQLVAVVSLYKALGGGWYGNDTAPGAPLPSTSAANTAQTTTANAAGTKP